MYPPFSSLLSRLLIDRKNGHRRAVLARYRELLRVSALPPDEILRYQDRCLADLFNHAAAHVPFWKNHIKQPVTPDNARQILAALPIMARSAIQADGLKFVVQEAHSPISGKSHIAHRTSEIVDDATGGSTGTPLNFKVDRRTQIAREASLYWANHLAGWRYGERVAMLWGSDRDVGKAKKDPRLERRWLIDNMRWYNAFDMGEDRMAAFHADLCRFRPHLIVAYAGSLEIFAKFLRDNIQHSTSNIIPYPLTSLVSSAEVLTPGMRTTIESVFNKPVFNRYGNRETGAIAAEDGGHDGFVVNEGDFVVEIDSRDPESEPGPILITYLSNYAMPFIRYNTGDLGLWCKRGAGRRKIARITGRQGDTIRTRDGKLIHGEYFTHLLYGRSDVRQFQFVQETLDHYRLLVVAPVPVPEATRSEWREKIATLVGAGCRIDVEMTDHIPPLPSGKYKFTLSKITSP